jgi:hypothetical protein
MPMIFLPESDLLAQMVEVLEANLPVPPPYGSKVRKTPLWTRYGVL